MYLISSRESPSLQLAADQEKNTSKTETEKLWGTPVQYGTTMIQVRWCGVCVCSGGVWQLTEMCVCVCVVQYKTTTIQQVRGRVVCVVRGCVAGFNWNVAFCNSHITSVLY